jgi:outer membrane protein assembly factor BamD
VMAERETQIGVYYEGKQNYPAAIARLQTVVDTYPLYSRSDQAWLAIGDAYAGQAHLIRIAPGMKGDVRERLRTMFEDKAAAAYAKVITRYPMAPRVEDARDRLVAMNRPVPEPTDAAVAESDAEQKSQRPLRFTDNILGIIKHGPTVVQSAHVGEPSLDDPKRTIAPEVSKQETEMMNTAVNAGKPAEPAAVTPTGPNEPPRSDQPSSAPLQMSAPAGGTGVGVSIVNAPNGEATPADGSGTAAPAAGNGSASPLVNSVGPTDSTLPAVDKPTDAPYQFNDIRQGTAQTQTAATEKQKKTKADLDEESSSKKKKKKGLGKLNPF